MSRRAWAPDYSGPSFTPASGTSYPTSPVSERPGVFYRGDRVRLKGRAICGTIVDSLGNQVFVHWDDDPTPTWVVVSSEEDHRTFRHIEGESR